MVLKDINDLIPDIQNKMELFKESIAYHLEFEASKIVPVDTGNLKDSISSGVDGDTVWVGAGFTKAVSYAAAVEFGTKNKDGTLRMKAQPYLRPAIFVVTQRLDRIFKTIFK
jgi:HK97 gp10 family phage protein